MTHRLLATQNLKSLSANIHPTYKITTLAAYEDFEVFEV
jgi:hypothetical protein